MRPGVKKEAALDKAKVKEMESVKAFVYEAVYQGESTRQCEPLLLRPWRSRSSWQPVGILIPPSC